ncbi:MAG: 50S ribosomal protein L11 methyltransferase [Clostridiaceae bacterium]|jgi:ribosomal protein L11 methyltransferase|nr:50S ribosomal protein L11 methyltransferase [Clostridiaceae bacterium]
MDWYEISILTNKEDLDLAAEILLEQGCGGVSIVDPDEVKNRLENPEPLDYVGSDLTENVPDHYSAKAYFYIDTDIDGIVSTITKRIKECCKGENHVLVKMVNDENWNSWKEYFKPFSLIEGITVVPSWEEYTPMPDEKTIIIDPGMAFGTGTHETTRLCSELVYRYVSEGYSFLDLGTGTGILSMVAKLKNAKTVTAVDIDDAAVRAAKENFQLNGIALRGQNGNEEGIEVIKGTLYSVTDRKFHVVAANIIAEVLIDLAPDMGRILTKPGFVILSGIIEKKEEEVLNAYRENGFEPVERIGENDWVAMVFQWRDFI